jgi:hypothetical protein
MSTSTCLYTVLVFAESVEAARPAEHAALYSLDYKVFVKGRECPLESSPLVGYVTSLHMYNCD